MQDVDVVLTTRELARMIKQAGIDFAKLPDEDFDDMLGESTGAGVIFGVTGGVMEAALRTVYEVVTGKTLDKVEFEDVRGFEGVKEACVKGRRHGREGRRRTRHRQCRAADGRGEGGRKGLSLHRDHGVPGRLCYGRRLSRSSARTCRLR